MALLNLINSQSVLFSAKYAAVQGLQTHMVNHRHDNIFYAVKQTADPMVEPGVIRRSGNYKPNVWDYDFLMSLGSETEFTHRLHCVNGGSGKYKSKAENLKQNVRHLLRSDSFDKLNMIDVVERLGVGYHFKEEIMRVLSDEFVKHDQQFDEDLYTTSLRFRLLRQHGYHASHGVFDRFRDESGSLEMRLIEDVKGLLSLYEASYLGLEGEDFLDEARAFTSKHLADLKGDINPTLAKKISHSLELPLHWRTTILEARWYIDIYESEDNMIPVLLDLAKLDFNMAQAIYQSEVGTLARWWVDLGLQKMDFSRDRLLEHYYWALGTVPEPEFGRARIELAKVGALITHIDDVYDVYGSLEELTLFTNAVERWDVGAMEQLPQYMKVTYMALIHTCNDISYKILKEQGIDITPNQKKAWVDLCKSYLQEAKWYYGGHTPSMEKYLDNGLVSIATPLVLMYSYFLTTENITKEAFDYIDGLPSLIHTSAVLFRLVDDLGTSSEEVARGDVPKSIQCYMHQAGVTEDIARDHVKQMVHESWKKMNKAHLARYTFSDTFVNSASHLDRQAHCVYQFGDGHGSNNDKESKDRLKSLIVEPILINYI